jgi:hypothetical protein
LIISEGALMNIGLISWKVLPHSSQIAKNMNTETPPRIFRS